MGRLSGKRCLVTGGSGGIGAAACRLFAQEGAAGVAVHYMGSQARAEKVAGQCAQLGARSFAVQADIARREPCEAMVRRVVEEWGGLDALVCFAGDPWRKEDWFEDFTRITDEALLKPWHIDVLGSVHCAQAAIPPMRAQRRGRILFTSSVPGLVGDVEGLSYLPAKAALAALAKSLARIYGRDGILVNALALGSVKTEAMMDLTAEEEAILADETALKRIAHPDEVARVAAFLCSDEASFLTGAAIPVDGGLAYH
jgi:3-oxoacyl-[acyl-carrier protein] reductase